MVKRKTHSSGLILDGNNLVCYIGYSSDHYLVRVEADYGDVAQLGEHLHGMQGVGGSSPPISTMEMICDLMDFVLITHTVLFGSQDEIIQRFLVKTQINCFRAINLGFTVFA